jgi:hypothetical protein
VLLAQKLYVILQFSYIGCAIEYKVYPVFYIYNVYNNMYVVLLYLKNLKNISKILNCSTLIAVGSCYSLCMLEIRVFTVSSCVRECNGAEIWTGTT